MAVTGHATAVVNGTIIADATEWEEIDGNVYFPPGTVKNEFLTETDHHTHCPWKGQASYYTVKVQGSELPNAAWYYPDTKPEAGHVRNHVAFYKTKVDVRKA